jgi:predicted Zn-ribbon and HTH transcriptional regulator
MEIEAGRGCRVGKGGVFVKEQDQASTLSEVRRRGASEKEPPDLGEELSREARVMKRRRARHETTPKTCGQRVFRDETPSIAAASTSR